MPVTDTSDGEKPIRSALPNPLANARPVSPAPSIASDAASLACPICLNGAIVRTQAHKVSQLLQALESRQAMSAGNVQELAIKNAELSHSLHLSRMSQANPEPKSDIFFARAILRTQLYFSMGRGFVEPDSSKSQFEIAEGIQNCDFTMPGPALRGQLRIDVGDMPGNYLVHEIQLSCDGPNGPVAWSFSGESLRRKSEVAGTARPGILPTGIQIVSLGDDPQLFFGPLGIEGGFDSAKVRVRVRISYSPTIRLDEISRSKEVGAVAHQIVGSVEERVLQVYFDGGNGFREQDMTSLPIVSIDLAAEYSLRLPVLSCRSLRIDVGSRPANVLITRLSLLSLEREGLRPWEVSGRQIPPLCKVQGTANGVATEEGLLVRSTGVDPQVVVPNLVLETGTRGPFLLKVQMSWSPA